MPSTSVKRAEIDSKIVFEEHPTLAWLGRFDEAVAGFLAQHGGRYVQELRGFAQVERAHDLVLVMAGHPRVVATGFEHRLALHVG